MSLLKTPLHSQHTQLGARMAPFAGYEMPISYDSFSGGIRKEHQIVREACGIFDVSHMGEFWLEGKDATAFLNHVTTRSFDKTPELKAQYCLLLNESGGMIDDIICYKLSDEKYWVVVNAANIQKDFKHLMSLATDFNISLTNRSDDIALVAVQGPSSFDILNQMNPEWQQLKYYGFSEWSDGPMVARTGYTGEDGLEMFIWKDQAETYWKKLINLGAKPIGLGARDSLRLEVGFPLYGQDLNDEWRPHETLVNFAVRNEADFFGSAYQSEKSRYWTIAVQGQNPKPIRHHDKIFLGGQEVGFITSGAFSPRLSRGIGIGLVRRDLVTKQPTAGMDFFLESAGKRRQVGVVDLPFVETRRVKKQC